MLRAIIYVHIRIHTKNNYFCFRCLTSIARCPTWVHPVIRRILIPDPILLRIQDLQMDTTPVTLASKEAGWHQKQIRARVKIPPRNLGLTLPNLVQAPIRRTSTDQGEWLAFIIAHVLNVNRPKWMIRFHYRSCVECKQTKVNDSLSLSLMC